MDEQEEVITLKPRKPGFGQKLSDFFKNPKKRLIFIIVCGVILIGAVASGIYFMNRPDNATPVATNKETKIKGTDYTTKYYNILDGTETDQGSANKHPLGVMIENHVDARPQAGLDKASVVYEAIAEGGITRFLALFSSHEADKVGPVRSARTYYVDWALGYNAYLAHVGGNYDALEQIISDKVLDLDQFKYSSSYWRDTSLKVSSEHTMFASTLKLRQQAENLKYTTDNNFKTYKFKEIKASDSAASSTSSTPSSASTGAAATAKTTEASTVAASQVNVNFSSANYNVVFQYDAASNTYKRLVSGKVQLDRESKAEIAPSNLIVMTVSRSPVVTKINEQGWKMTTVGEGKAKIFVDGKVIEGTWVKDAKTSRETFYDAQNQEITFNRGQFWICVIPPDSSVSYE